MAETWVEIDGVPERELPAHAQDGRSGDRVSALEAGLLHVSEGRGTFVPWGTVLGVLEDGGQVYVLVPRRPPAQPWLEVDRAMLGRDDPKAFAQRIEERGAGGGYRDAVRKRRQNLPVDTLRAKISAREAVPGALEVPSTIMLGVSYPGLAAVQLLVLGMGFVIGYVAMIVPMVAMTGRYGEVAPIATFFGYGLFLASILGAGWAAIAVGKRWREAKNKTLPRQRVLVLAPDGCVVGFRTGVRALSWAQVGAFEVGQNPETYDQALVVKGAEGERLGDVDAAWLDAPLSLVVRVAEAYRVAARD